MSAATGDLPSLAAVGALAQEAGRAIMAIYARGEVAVEEKADHSPLTAADLASNRIIVAGLRALAPDVPVLSEESAGIAWETRQQWMRYWLVDPLDGTKEFLKRNGEFTVNIALIDRHAPALGVVLAPVTGDLYVASADGAYLHAGGAGAGTRLHTRTAASPPVVAGSRSHGGARQAALLSRIAPYTSVPMGSSLKFCLIARGAADLYVRPGPTSEWDTAAAQCVLERAGGAVTTLEGAPLAYNTQASLINPEFLAVGDPAHDWPSRLDRRAEGTVHG